MPRNRLPIRYSFENVISRFESTLGQRNYKILVDTMKLTSDTNSQEPRRAQDFVNTAPRVAKVLIRDLPNENDRDPDTDFHLFSCVAYLLRNPSLYKNLQHDTLVQIFTLLIEHSTRDEKVKIVSLVVLQDVKAHVPVLKQVLKSKVLPLLSRLLSNEESSRVKMNAVSALKHMWSTDLRTLMSIHSKDWILPLIPLVAQKDDLSLQMGVVSLLAPVPEELFRSKTKQMSSIEQDAAETAIPYLFRCIKDTNQTIQETKVWTCFCRLCGATFFKYSDIINKALLFIKKCFVHPSWEVRREGFNAWKSLMSNMAKHAENFSTDRYMNLLLKPLRSHCIKEKNENVLQTFFETWLHYCALNINHVNKDGVFKKVVLDWIPISFDIVCRENVKRQLQQQIIEVVLAFLVNPSRQENTDKMDWIPRFIYEAQLTEETFQSNFENCVNILGVLAAKIEDPQYTIRFARSLLYNANSTTAVTSIIEALEDLYPICENDRRDLLLKLYELSVTEIPDAYYSSGGWKLSVNDISCEKSLGVYSALSTLLKRYQSFNHIEILRILNAIWQKQQTAPEEKQIYFVQTLLDHKEKFKTDLTNGFSLYSIFAHWFCSTVWDVSLSFNYLKLKLKLWEQTLFAYSNAGTILQECLQKTFSSQNNPKLVAPICAGLSDLKMSNKDHLPLFIFTWKYILKLNLQNQDHSSFINRTCQLLKGQKEQKELILCVAEIIGQTTGKSPLLQWTEMLPNVLIFYKTIPREILTLLHNYAIAAKNLRNLNAEMSENLCSLLNAFAFSNGKGISEEQENIVGELYPNLLRNLDLEEHKSLNSVIMRQKQRIKQQKVQGREKKRPFSSAFERRESEENSSKKRKRKTVKVDSKTNNLQRQFALLEDSFPEESTDNIHPSFGKISEQSFNPYSRTERQTNPFFPSLLNVKQPWSESVLAFPNHMKQYAGTLQAYQTLGDFAKLSEDEVLRLFKPFGGDCVRRVKDVMKRLEQKLKTKKTCDGVIFTLDKLKNNVEQEGFSMKDLVRVHSSLSDFNRVLSNKMMKLAK